MAEAIKIYGMLVEAVAPLAITFAFGNLIFVTFLEAAFGGKLRL